MEGNGAAARGGDAAELWESDDRTLKELVRSMTAAFDAARSAGGSADPPGPARARLKQQLAEAIRAVCEEMGIEALPDPERQAWRFRSAGRGAPPG